MPESGETCDDGNTTDGDCCSSSCQRAAAGSACSDGNACTQSDACDAAGHCTAGAALSCNDGNLCTDDPVCDLASGCPPSQAKTGVAGVICHLDAINAALAAASADELTAAGRRSIGAAVSKARTKVELAARSTGGKRGAKLLRSAQTALRGITMAINAASRKKQIKGALVGTVAGQASGALGGSRALASS